MLLEKRRVTEIDLAHLVIASFSRSRFPRQCRQNNLVQMTIARIWQIARKDAAFLA